MGSVDEITRDIYRDRITYVLWHEADVRQKHTIRWIPSEFAQALCSDFCPGNVDRMIEVGIRSGYQFWECELAVSDRARCRCTLRCTGANIRILILYLPTWVAMPLGFRREWLPNHRVTMSEPLGHLCCCKIPSWRISDTWEISMRIEWEEADVPRATSS